MKKLLTLMLITTLISLVGCSTTTKENSYTADTYTGTGIGMKGPILMDVTFSEDSITNITVNSSLETAYLADPAFENIPKAIIENQSLDIDTITGATMTSNGIINAVSDAVNQAGGDTSILLENKVEIQAQEPIEGTYDVVVVGGGGAGLAAAISAAEEGSSVLIVEKAGYLGGNTLVAGKVYNSANPEVQQKAEIDDSLRIELEGYLKEDPKKYEDYSEIVVTVQKQIKEYLDSGESYLFDSPELHTMQWYIGGSRTGLDGTTIKPNFDLVSTISNNALETLDWMKSHDITVSDSTFTVLGALWPRTHATFTTENGSIIGTFEQQALDLGVEIMTETEAKELMEEDGKVIGVKSVKSDGTEVTSYANGGVILATGGYAANAKMVAEYDNYWGEYVTDTTKSTNVGTATGDGIVMAEQIGANLVGMGYSQMMPSSHPITGTMTDGIWGSAESQVFVNSEGVRYVNEYAERDVLSKAALDQENGLFYIIGDNDILSNYEEDVLINMQEAGHIFYADTLEELAEKMGVPVDNFVNEMKKYNSYVDDNLDPDFGKSNFGDDKIDKGPYCATPRIPSLHHTMGGVEINTDTQVIDTEGNVIEGLYAAGEVTGGIHAGNRLGGNATADIMVFGRIAGTKAAAATSQ
ncbi:flavocytochrome c [Alkalibaculum sp. M08DMB]|uniref:Urocanate reductase n=1 Tax=Alkalibaculum sporogenes TaxID=2655001 RepID=A0A6A7K8F4_9FIRM|nr:flavocytochrome c [Alkalibaculum sporogenes]MPW25655.1 flavocytochrome c [Alkalibaculum sporogenes]